MSSRDLLINLLEEGKIKRQETDTAYLNGLLDSAQENFSSAKYNLKGDFYETAFKATYDGLLQTARVVLFLKGYRPAGSEQHKTTFLAVGFVLGEDFEDLIRKIDKYRIKRNRAVYQPLSLISKSEAENILHTARDYWSLVKKHLKEEESQLKLFDF